MEKDNSKKKIFFVKVYIKTERKWQNLVVLNSKNKIFTKIKIPISINNTDTNKIVVSNKVCFGKKRFKYFIGCKEPLCIFPP